MKPRRRLQGLFAAVGMAVGLLFSPASAAAQSEGSIAGVVRDTTGAVLPGVTVEASSPALIEKVRAAVADDQGNYRIVNLRPGTYTVTFTLPGFRVIKREGVELTTGFTATINADMAVGGLEETLTVTGATPVVDVQNVRQQTVFRKAEQEALPVGRAIGKWAAVIPALTLTNASEQDVGGNSTKGNYVGAHGIVGSVSMGMFLDGMTFKSMQSTSALIVNPAGLEETAMQMSGVTAESQNGTVQMNLIPRDGGNRYSATASVNYSNDRMQSDNVSPALFARGSTGVSKQRLVRTINGGLGGPIVRDRLWFFTAHEQNRLSKFQAGLFANATPDAWVYTRDPNSQATKEDDERDHSYRFTWQITNKNKLSVHIMRDGTCLCPYIISTTSAPEAASRFLQTLPLYQAKWNYPASNRLLFEAGVTAALLESDKPYAPGVTRDTISVLESTTNFRYRSMANNYGPDEMKQVNQKFAVSYVTGTHSFKTGVQTLQGWRIDPYFVNRDINYTFRDGVPLSVTVYATPQVLRDRAREVGIFAQDQWTIQRWTLSMGVRYDSFVGTIPRQPQEPGTFIGTRDFPGLKDVPNWKDIVPRLGAAYDVFGNGKTALKVALGRYIDWEASGTVVSPQNPLNTLALSANRTWNDANRDFVPQESELGPLSDANFGTVRPGTRFADDVRLGWGTRDYNWQTAVQVQQELFPGVALNVGYFRTWFGNFWVTDNLAVTPRDYDPFCITAPVDSRLPVSGQQVCGLYDINPAKFGLVDNLVTQASNFGNYTQVFNGVDATIDMRVKAVTVSGGLSTGTTDTDNCDTIVDSPDKRFCHTKPSWGSNTQVKFSAIVPLPWDFRASWTVQSIPGSAIIAQYVATNAQIAPSLGRNLGQCRGAAVCNGTVLVDLIEPNTVFEPRLNQLDLRVSRIFRLGRSRVQGNVDFYNLLNKAASLLNNARFGPSWTQPTAVLGPRMIKVGFQFDL